MKKIFLILAIMLFAYSASGANYYLSSAGSGSGVGSEGDPLKTIAEVNAINFGDGDVLNLRYGDTFNDTNLKLTAVTGTIAFTIQAAEFGGRTVADGLPKFDADVISVQWNANSALAQNGAISINNSLIPGTITTLTIKNIQFEGQTTSDKLDWVWVYGVNAVTIDGVTGNGHGGGTYTYGNDGVEIHGGTGIVEIKNCNIQNLGPNTIPTNSVGDTYAFNVEGKTSGSVLVHDNVVHDINADAIQVKGLTGLTSAAIYDNEFYDCGENAVDIKASDGFLIYGNNFYRNGGFTGKGGVGGSSWPLIGVIPSTETGSGDHTSDNIKIYNNYLHDNVGSPAVYIGYTVDGYRCAGAEVYQNWMTACDTTIFIGTSGVNTKIYGNIIRNSTTYAFHENNNMSGTVLKNNDLVNGAGMGAILKLEYSNATIQNNFFYQTDTGDLIIDWDGAGSPTVSYNRYFNVTAGDQNIIDWNGTVYTEAQIDTWDNTHAGESFADPSFADVGAGQLWPTTPIAGTTPYSPTGLLPTSTWTPTINVETGVWPGNYMGAYLSGGIFSISTTDATASEAGSATGAYTVTCSGCLNGETVEVAFSGTATITDDYTTDYSPITWAGSPVVITLTPVSGDGLCEAPEYARATLQNAVGGYISLTASYDDVSIVDDTSDCGATASGSAPPTSRNSSGPTWSRDASGPAVVGVYE